MSTTARIRIPVVHHMLAGIPHAHVSEASGPVVWVTIDYLDKTGREHLHRFRCILREGHGGQWINVTLARSGQSIARVTAGDYHLAGVHSGNRSRPRQVAQALINRLAYEHGPRKLAQTLLLAEQAGPVCNPEVLA